MLRKGNDNSHHMKNEWLLNNIGDRVGFRSLISFVLFLLYVLDLKINDRNKGETTFFKFFS